MGRLLLFTFCFVAFLYPLSMNGVSVNYTFVLIPVLWLTLYGKLQRPADSTLIIIGLFVCVLIFAFFYQLSLGGAATRRIISFIIFMTVFAYTFVKVDQTMVNAFKVALVGISVFFALRSMILLLAAGSGIGFEAKDLVGSQRFGFIYLMAVWVVYFHQRAGGAFRLLKPALLIILIAGVLLTFSRSTVISLLATVLLFGVREHWEWINRPNVIGIAKLGMAVVGITVLIVALQQIVPLTFRFFGERLFGLLLDSDAVMAQLRDPGASPGTRIVLLRQILDFVGRNPVTGSGYLGVWILPDAPTGSAHNQYADVLFRTGVLGFAAYGYLLFRIGKFLAKEQTALFWGFVSVLIYGMFHETFKESQGAFVLAFLLGMMAQGARSRLAMITGRGASVVQQGMTPDGGLA